MSNTIENRQWRLVSRPSEQISEKNFEIHTEKLQPLSENQVLLQNNYLSFDPTQRIWAVMDSYMPKVEMGEVMRAFGIGQVIESRDKRYQKGDMVFANVGWQDYKIIDTMQQEIFKPQIIPGFLDPITVLALGITGVTAYIGIQKIARVGTNDVVLVSGAAGAVGSMVCQIAKLKGARVIGIAGGKHKCSYLLDKLKIDAAIDYKTDNISEKIDHYAGDGISIFFDNVGGEVLDTALTKIRKFARIVLCGAISEYNQFSANHSKEPSATKNVFNLIIQSARMEGFVLTDYMKESAKSMMALHHWLEQEKIHLTIDMQKGFEEIPSTLQRLFTGENIGKQLLTLSEPALALNSSKLQEKLFRAGGYVFGM